MQRQNQGRTGFTLIEVSIVLVIIGLLIGGVLSGKYLIRAGELRSVATEQQQFGNAVTAFRDKYQAYPGDMLNAVKFWGRADDGTFTGQCAAPMTNLGTGKQTCNGNGDGIVMDDTQISAVFTSEHEKYRFWQHLANADLIGGSFTGIGPGVNEDKAGINSPESKLAATGWGIVFSTDAGDTLFPFTYYKNALILGFTTGGYYLNGEELYGLDEKLDDGKPMTGKVLAYGHLNCTNSAGANLPAADYVMTSAEPTCNIIFNHLF